MKTLIRITVHYSSFLSISVSGVGQSACADPAHLLYTTIFTEIFGIITLLNFFLHWFKIILYLLYKTVKNLSVSKSGSRDSFNLGF